MRKGIIYAYRNKESGNMYIGQTVKPEQRYYQHLYQETTGWHMDYRRHPEKYEYFVLEKDIDEDKLDEREIYYIKKYDTYNHGYN